MIKQLTLTNFRKHESTTLGLGLGLSVIRGQNEAGKSTLTESIVYALFGAKSLRTPLADTVTWGKPETSLKVGLVLESGGKDYTFARSKSGAEVSCDGAVIVTGQNEVSNYSSHLLGVDVQAASRLMMASQNGLRGALEQGPKATAQAIEELADFDLFDRLLERMQEKLLLGAPALLEGRLNQATETLENTPDPVKPDSKATAQEIATLQGKVEEHLRTVAEFEPKQQEIQSRVDRAEVAQRMHEGIVNDLRRAREQHALRLEQIKANVVKAGQPVNEAEIAALREQIRDATAQIKRLGVYKVFSDLLPSYQNWARSNSVWEGDKESFDAEVQASGAEEQRLQKAKAKLEGDVRALQAQRITASACGLCGKDVSELPVVIEKNAEIDRGLAAAASEILSLTGSIAEAGATRNTLESIQAQDAKMSRELFGISDLQLDHATVPPSVKWVGDIPSFVAQEDCKGRLDALEAARDEVATAKAKIAALSDTLAEDVERIARLESQFIEYPAIGSIAELKDELNDVATTKLAAQYWARTLGEEIAELNRQLQQAEMEFSAASERKASAAAQVLQAKLDLEELAFNNALLKKIRAARPIIADKLWTLVLTSVSTLFSQMRGKKSVVAKGKDGFSVNGQAVESLSGSTLDLLGLAIRVALVKTFLPHCPFMVLDEPGAAMDDSRNAAMLGFIQGSGFKQVVLVTHEEASSSLADQLIEL